MAFTRGMRLARNRPEQNLAASFSGRQRNHFFANRGSDDFARLSALSGLDHAGDSRGFALLDYDRDGRTDLALVNANRPLLTLYRNRVARPEGVAVRLVGANWEPVARAGAGNRDGIGARIEVLAAGRTQSRERRAGEGLAAQNSATLLFGLDGESAARRIIVRWPSGVVSEIADVEAGSLLTVYENPASSPTGSAFEVTSYRLEVARAAAPVDLGPTLPLQGAKAAAPPLTLVTSVATWCQACRDELPRLRHLRRSLPSEVAFVGLAIDGQESREQLLAFAEEHQPPYELLAAPEPALRRRFREVGLAALHQEVVPTTALVDARGRVLRVFAGAPTLSDVREVLSRVEPPAAG